MPHAVILHADRCPTFGNAPLSREQGVIHKVAEIAETPSGWLLKSLIIQGKESTRFFTRIDRREDGLNVHLDDHIHVERTDQVFDHLALIAKKVLDENAGSELGATNLEARVAKLGGPAPTTEA